LRSSALSRFRRLQMVVDFTLDHQCLLPPWTEDRTTHYPSRLILSDHPVHVHLGQLEARIVYEQDSAYDPRDDYAAVCRMIWDREADWNRCRSKNPVRPTIRRECFRVDRDGLVKINRSMTTLAKRVGPFEFDELILDQLPETKGPYRIARVPARVRRVTFGASTVRVDLSFWNKYADPSFNRAWERVWRTLGSIMTDGNKFGPSRLVTHGMTADQFARSLATRSDDSQAPAGLQ